MKLLKRVAVLIISLGVIGGGAYSIYSGNLSSIDGQHLEDSLGSITSNLLSNVSQLVEEKITDIRGGSESEETSSASEISSEAVTESEPSETAIVAQELTESPEETTAAQPIMLATPEITSIENVANGVEIHWNPIEEAQQYQILRKTEESDWELLDTATDTTYADTEVVGDTEYTYTVACMDADTDTLVSEYDLDGISIHFIDCPEFHIISNMPGSVLLSWNAVPGASHYRIMRLDEDGTWESLITTNTTLFSDTTVESGNEYTYSIVCVDDNEESEISAFDREGKSIFFVAAPSGMIADNSSSGVTLSWEETPGATAYSVWRKDGANTWNQIGNAQTTEFLDSDVIAGQDYSYTIKCTDEDGQVISAFDNTGLSHRYITAPKNLKASLNTNSISLSWNASDGAVNYRILRKKNNQKWIELGDTKTTNYEDTQVKDGINYSYTVRCVDTQGKKYESDYDQTGKTITFYSAPKGIKSQNVVDGIQLKWKAKNNISHYCVYRKDADGGWRKLSNTDKNTFIDKNVESGTNYAYTISCLDESGKTSLSAYDPSGSAIKCLSAITKDQLTLSPKKKGIEINWDKVKGAAGYFVYKKLGKDSYEMIADINRKTTSYVDTDASEGEKLTYAVRAYAKGKDTLGDYSGNSIVWLKSPSVSNIYGGTEQLSYSLKKGVKDSNIQLQYSKNSDFSNASTKNISSLDGLLELASAGTYYVRCRTSKTIDGKEYYSNWSNTKSIEIQAPKVETKSTPQTASTTQDYMVYITDTGECYHSRSCGRGNFYESTLSYAKKLGLRPCGRCWR